MTEAEFGFLRRLLKARSGLDLGPDKRYLVETRLGPVCREHGFSTMSDLIERLRAPGEDRLAESVLDAMATKETLFFRDRAVFEALRTEILPGLVDRRRAGRQIRIWCAAASTGQEPYSVAMTLAEPGLDLKGWRVSILATDLSASALERARLGAYSQFEVQRGLPIRCLLRFFTQEGETWTVRDELRRNLEFRRLNLLSDFARLGSFDVIFCRNILIYLDPAAKADVLSRMAEALALDGSLCLGATENALGHPGLEPDPVAAGFYRRTPPRARRPVAEPVAAALGR